MSHSIEATRSSTPMWVYERNHVYLLPIIEACMQDEQLSCLHHYQTGHFEFKISSQCKYTLEMDIQQVSDISEFMGQGVSFKVRIYLDAELAEVVHYLGHSRLLPGYAYPNEHMWQPDEKKQANLLLHDCLLHIAEHGMISKCVEY